MDMPRSTSATQGTAGRDATDGASNPTLILVSHVLCPYVQRAAIVLAEKGVHFERRDIDLARKPAWFLAVSPLGKTPVLQVGDHAIFESSVICEYLDETLAPRLHPQDALARARHRAWMAFASALLNLIGAFYNAPDEAALAARGADIRRRLEQIEDALGEGPYFAGQAFGLVDAAMAPAFRYFDAFDAIGEFGFWHGLQKVQDWRRALARRASVATAVRPDYAEQLRVFLRARGSALSGRLAG